VLPDDSAQSAANLHNAVSLLGFLAEGMGRAEMSHEFGERRGKHRGPRGGHGPEGRGSGGRGPWARGPRGDRGPEHSFGSGRHGSAPEERGPEGHGFRRPRWFMGDPSGSHAAPDGPEPNDTSFV
jgi:hypothetical protein